MLLHGREGSHNPNPVSTGQRVIITIELSAIGSTGKTGKGDGRIYQLYEGILRKSQLD